MSGSAPMVATWPPPCTTVDLGRQRDPAETPGYAVVWDLRSPSTPPVRVPTGTDPQAMALSPDGRTLYTGWPLTAYDVATGKRIWRREDITIWSGPRRERRGDPAGRSADTGSRKDALLVSASDRGDGPHAAWTPGPGRATSGSRPTARWWGRHSDDGELIVWDTATGRPLERWDTFAPLGRRLQPGR